MVSADAGSVEEKSNRGRIAVNIFFIFQYQYFQGRANFGLDCMIDYYFTQSINQSKQWDTVRGDMAPVPVLSRDNALHSLFHNAALIMR